MVRWAMIVLIHARKTMGENLPDNATPKNHGINVVDIDAIVVDATAIRYQWRSVR